VKKTISLPYGRGCVSCDVGESREINVLRAVNEIAATDSGGDEAALIAAALAAPINSPPLSELARGRKKVVVITSDHTRPVPSRLTLPLLLKEIRTGSPEADITVLIAVGSHRATTRAEMEEKFGAGFVAREKIINHDPHDPAGLVSLGTLPSGGELILNRLAVEADLFVADGFIEPHQFAGFSGGRKSVLPGIAGLSTVLASHNAEFTAHPLARPGSLEGNPFQVDMLHAARVARLAFIVNVTLTAAKKVEAAFAGEPEAAHLAGCQHVLRHCGVKAAPAPVVIAGNGGYPLDRNLYQSVKSLVTAGQCCAPGGVIIAVNECGDGHGGEAFHRDFREAGSPEALWRGIVGRGRNDTRPDQWVEQLTADVLRRHKIIAVSQLEPDILRDFGLIPAPDLGAALHLADEITGQPQAPITVLPEAVAVVIQ
jgi:nickel-dependent lactate racemase